MRHQKSLYQLSYDRRLQKYHEEKQQLIRKNPMIPPAELQEAIKGLSNKYRI